MINFGSLFLIGDSIMDHFHYGLMLSPPIFGLAALDRRVDLKAAFLFALSAPGAVAGIAVSLLGAIDNPTMIESWLFLVVPFYFPALWIMPLTAAVQMCRLWGPKRPLTLSATLTATLTAMLIIGLYFQTKYFNQL